MASIRLLTRMGMPLEQAIETIRLAGSSPDSYFIGKGDSRALWKSADGFSWKLAAMELPHVRLENGRPITPFCAIVGRGSWNSF